jgi:hypothetical protein
VAEAEAILAAAHGRTTEAYAIARADMEPRVRHFEKLVAGMLDDDKLRIVERRYTGDRGEPDPRCLAAEATARTYLASRDRHPRMGAP